MSKYYNRKKLLVPHRLKLEEFKCSYNTRVEQLPRPYLNRICSIGDRNLCLDDERRPCDQNKDHVRPCDQNVINGQDDSHSSYVVVDRS